MVSALINEDSRRWKVDTLKSLFFPFEVETILNIPLSYSLPEDKIIWIRNKRGEFSVKSAYYVALTVINSSDCGESSHGDPRIPLWKRIWQLKIPPKIRIFCWKACVCLTNYVKFKKKGGEYEWTMPRVWAGGLVYLPCSLQVCWCQECLGVVEGVPNGVRG